MLDCIIQIIIKNTGCGAETPTSEPGYCATDLWDLDWDEDPEDFFVYRHQVIILCSLVVLKYL